MYLTPVIVSINREKNGRVLHSLLEDKETLFDLFCTKTTPLPALPRVGADT